ncbi:MAG: OB-fold putative lipoprotein [Dehalococcoidales bacterium]|nr:OB-fold putative lipoprotein [Dehalococcoidales bacterium]
MTLTVDQLDALFRADKMGTHGQLTGKTVIIQGMVTKVFVRDHIDVRYIMLDGMKKKGAWSVRCVFEKAAVNQLAHLEKGQPAAIQGKYDGFSKNIILKDCTLAS